MPLANALIDLTTISAFQLSSPDVGSSQIKMAGSVKI
jgi:hypothetical protein